MAEPKITKRKITDYTPDPMNANRGTERGQYMVDYSVQEVGAGRSIVSAADDVIPIGNHALQAFVDAGIEDVIEVETDGQTVVVVKRSDWPTADDPRARKAALLDNRASEVGLQWNADILAQLQAEDAALLDGLFRDDELAALLEQLPSYDDWASSIGDLPDGDKSPFMQMTFTLHDTQSEIVARALTLAKSQGEFVDSPNENSNGNALARICDTYITQVGIHG